jgi:hypothetical protein
MRINFIFVVEHEPSCQNSLARFVIMCCLFSSSIYQAVCTQWPQISRLRIATWKRRHSIYSQRWGSPCAYWPSKKILTRSFSGCASRPAVREVTFSTVVWNLIVSPHNFGRPVSFESVWKIFLTVGIFALYSRYREAEKLIGSMLPPYSLVGTCKNVQICTFRNCAWIYIMILL